MSGHSKWSNIKHRKGAQDAKRAKVFTKLLRAIQLAVRDGGNDPEMNAQLRYAIGRAKSFNVPKDTIDRALKKNEGVQLEELTFDAIGPGGVQMIIECVSDNKNRTVSEVRSIVEKNGGKLAQDGAARWAFTRAGLVVVELSEETDKDELLLSLLDCGADDVREEEDSFVAITDPTKFTQILGKIEAAGVSVADSMLGWDSNQKAAISEDDREKLEKLSDLLDDHDDVQAVWSNT